jgi:hypothetical protein
MTDIHAPAGFEPAIPAGELCFHELNHKLLAAPLYMFLPLDRSATGIGLFFN